MKPADAYLADALALVRAAQAEAYALALDHLERSGLSPDEAARMLRRRYPVLSDETMRRHAAMIAPVLVQIDALKAITRSFDDAVATGDHETPGGGIAFSWPPLSGDRRGSFISTKAAPDENGNALNQ